MLLIVIFDGAFSETYSLLFMLVDKIHSIFPILLFSLLCFSALSATIQAELHATTVHFVKHILKSKKTLKSRSYVKNGILLDIRDYAFHLVYHHPIHQIQLIEFLFFYGSIYASCILDNDNNTFKKDNPQEYCLILLY